MSNTNSLNIFNLKLKEIPELVLISAILSLPAILAGGYLVYFIPVFFLVFLALVFGERFLILFVVISLFTIVGEVSRILRSLVYLLDFSILGYFFLKRYGLNLFSYPKIPRSVIYLLILYFSAMIISAVMSRFPSAASGIIFQQFAFFIIVYVFYALIENKENINLYFAGISVVAVIIVAFSLVVFINDGLNLIEIISPDRARVSVITGNIETSTNFFVVIFPILLGMFLLSEKVSSKTPRLILLLFLSIGLILMMSRSAIIGILFSTALIFFILHRKLFYRLLIVVVSLVLIFVLYQPLNETITVFLRLESGMSARDYLWKMSMDMIKDNMIFGLGPGVYKHEMMNYFPYMLDEWWGRFVIYLSEVSGGANLSHNFFLSLFTELGILGILTAIALPVVYLRIGIKTILKYRMEDKSNYYLIVSLFAAGCSIIIRNFFNGIGLLYVGGLQTDLPFWLIFSSLIYFYQVPVVSNNKSTLD